jgi:phosphate:Na+ symporter
MEYFYIICELLAGLGVFLVGCKLLSDNMEKLATKKIKSLFLKTSDKKLVGVGIGCATTALVQSSGLTTVMVIGLVNAGIMTLFQAATIIIGANIGTTITAHIASLQTFKFIEIAIGLTGIGALINVFTSKEKLKTLGNIFSGLGLIFVGLILMQESMVFLKSSPMVVELLESIKNPFLLFLIGIIFTALIQSSSAITSIIISMAAAGILIGGGGNAVLFIILGSNIGSCATSLLSSIGASSNAKRSSIIHLLFNTFGAIIFFVLLVAWDGFMDATFAKIFDQPATQIAMFHTFFNVVCACIFLPFTKGLVKLSEMIVKDKKQEPVKVINMDERMLQYPSVAIGQLTKEMSRMGYEAMEILNLSLQDFLTRSESNTTLVKQTNERLDLMNKEIIYYLVNITGVQVTLHEEKIISSFHHNLNDIMRIGEIADNITKYTNGVIKDNLEFSETVKLEIGKMNQLIIELHKLTDETFTTRKTNLMNQINEIEDQVDNMRAKLVEDHLERLKHGKCQPQSSGVFINLVNNLERAADHLTYIAESIE